MLVTVVALTQGLCLIDEKSENTDEGQEEWNEGRNVKQDG